MAPKPGDNKIVFKLTDKFSNTTTTDVFITREQDITKQPLIRPEYNRVIAKKQITAITGMLRSRSDDKLLSVIKAADLDRQQFGRVDDLLSYLKEEAAKKSISPEELDKLALRVAVMDNVLTQAAVDLMAKYTTGDLKNILTGLNIYKENLKTWTDLQKYILAKTDNKISPEELNKIAASVLADVDPDIAILRNKILAYSENSEVGNILRQSVAIVDISNIRLKEKWLQAFYYESGKLGLASDKLAELLVQLSSAPGTQAEQFLRNLIELSEEPLRTALKALDLKKENIKSSNDLILFLMKNKDKYPEDAVSKSIAALITSKNLPADMPGSLSQSSGRNKFGVVWFLIGIAFLFILIAAVRRRKKNSDPDKK